LRFDQRVAIITGAGGSLGRQYALALGGRGCRVVVNDFNLQAAQKVVDEIIALGGDAVANSSNVLDGEAIVKTAIDKWGRIDIIVNNAGILRDVSFQNMTTKQWNEVLDVHLHGSYNVTRAAWPHMKNARYGRIVMVTSVVGLYGSFGQANYSAAKSAVLGLAKSLAKEGVKANIKVNVVAPGAGSAMTQTVLPKNIVEAWKPDYVAPFVAWMCHADFPETGKIYEAGGGYFGEVHWSRTKGAFFDLDKPYNMDDVKRRWTEIIDRKGESDPETITNSPGPQMVQILKNIPKSSKL